ncbi:nitroreductase [Cellulophaga baltica]|uniref:nitroreductase family protein n=1 Tax=Cellulophaga TaxID=104264 RepID=UPI001C069825|nr:MULTISPECIES: nitroreductase [Cellulophaga]MBU2996783.1 nitroreductase [Cellulophaga baltica]MDO6768179.1 nitroreductase [Cellulophaga sp. 1_MG-2023]
MTIKAITKLIKERKSTYAYDFSEKEIPKNTIEDIVENALWAPTHLHTQPWRFIVLKGKHQQELGEFMADYYREMYTEKKFSNERFEATKNYSKNATLLAVIFKPNKKAKLPEWEELAAIACGVQNMWLSCTALNIGCYWDTSVATMKYGKSIDLDGDEKFLGIFYMGHLKNEIQFRKRKRKSLSKKLSYDYKN